MPKLLLFPDPLLSKRAEPIQEISEETHKLVKNILQVMEEHGAIGLSACHIGVFQRLLIVYEKVYINPKLSSPSKEKEVMEEGSISLPGIRVPIERPKSITVEAQNLDGETFTETLEGLPARILMHENDQLNGLFFLLRLPKEKRVQQ